MLEEYFSAPKTLRLLRTGPSGSYIDSFADALKRAGYSKVSAIRYLRNAAHLDQFTKRVGGGLGTIDVNTLKAFCRPRADPTENWRPLKPSFRPICGRIVSSPRQIDRAVEGQALMESQRGV